MQIETARKLAEIFSSAGQAFSHMAELTMQLHTPTSNGNGESQPLSGKWTDKEVDLLKGAVERFGSDLDKIGSVIKNRTHDQVKKQVTNNPNDSNLKSPTAAAKGSENVPVRPVEEKKPRLPPPSSASSAQAVAGGPVIRKVANPSIAPVTGIAPPLVLTAKPPPERKEQKARRGGGSSSGAGGSSSGAGGSSNSGLLKSGPGPASRTQGAAASSSSNLPPHAGPKLASMLESGKRAAAAGVTESPESKRIRQISEYERLKMLREVEDDYTDESESDSDASDSDDDDDDDE